jgi:hypothetical protein
LPLDHFHGRREALDQLRLHRKDLAPMLASVLPPEPDVEGEAARA